MSTTMWPSSAPAPTQPRYSRPPSTSPPPIPVPIVSIATSEQPFAAPARASAQTAQLASLSTSTGRPSRSDMTSANGRSASGRLTAWTAIAGPAVERAGDPEADRVDFPAHGIASLLDGVDHRLEQRRLVDPEDLPARSVVDGEPLRIDGSGQELRPAEIDADHAAGRHFDHDTPFAMADEKPTYTRYRSRPKLFGKRLQRRARRARRPARRRPPPRGPEQARAARPLHVLARARLHRRVRRRLAAALAAAVPDLRPGPAPGGQRRGRLARSRTPASR